MRYFLILPALCLGLAACAPQPAPEPDCPKPEWRNPSCDNDAPAAFSEPPSDDEPPADDDDPKRPNKGGGNGGEDGDPGKHPDLGNDDE